MVCLIGSDIIEEVQMDGRQRQYRDARVATHERHAPLAAAAEVHATIQPAAGKRKCKRTSVVHCVHAARAGGQRRPQLQLLVVTANELLQLTGEWVCHLRRRECGRHGPRLLADGAATH